MNGRDPLSQRLDALGKRIEEIGAWRDHDVRPVGGEALVLVDGVTRLGTNPFHRRLRLRASDGAVDGDARRRGCADAARTEGAGAAPGRPAA